MSEKSKENNTKGTNGVGDNKLLMETLMSQLDRLLISKLETVQEQIDQIENKRVERQQNAPFMNRRGRAQPRGARNDDEVYNDVDFVEECDRNSMIDDRRHGGQSRVRNHEDKQLEQY